MSAADRRAMFFKAAVAVCGAALGGGWGAAHAAARFLAVDLGTLGGTISWAYSINEAGVVVGSAFALGDDNRRAAIATGNSFQMLAGTAGDYSDAIGINASGQVVGGWRSSYEYGLTGFVYSSGTVQPLGTLGGAYTFAATINASGQIVGHSSLPGDSWAGATYHAFSYSTGALQDLGTFGGLNSFANDINDAGQVVGTAELPSAARMAFLYEGGVMRPLGTLGGQQSRANGISGNGLIAGGAETADGKLQAFLYQGGVLQNLGTLGGDSAEGYAVNDSGWVVGRSDLAVHSVAGMSYAPFLYRDGVMTDLNDLMDLPADWFLSEALDINNSGQIAATACDVDFFACRAFRLDPVPAVIAVPLPGTLWLALCGLGIAAALAHRRANSDTANPVARA